MSAADQLAVWCHRNTQEKSSIRLWRNIHSFLSLAHVCCLEKLNPIAREIIRYMLGCTVPGTELGQATHQHRKNRASSYIVYSQRAYHNLVRKHIHRGLSLVKLLQHYSLCAGWWEGSGAISLHPPCFTNLESVKKRMLTITDRWMDMGRRKRICKWRTECQTESSAPQVDDERASTLEFRGISCAYDLEQNNRG